MSERTCTGLDLACWFSEFLDALGRMFVTVFIWIAEALIALIDMVSGGIFHTDVSSLVDQVPDTVWWFASVVQLDVGAGIMITAWIARFILRRIPFIG